MRRNGKEDAQCQVGGSAKEKYTNISDLGVSRGNLGTQRGTLCALCRQVAAQTSNQFLAFVRAGTEHRERCLRNGELGAQ